VTIVNNQSLARMLDAATEGKVVRHGDWRYYSRRKRPPVDVDDLVYAAEQRGLLVLLTDGQVQVTDAGRELLDRWESVHKRKQAPAENAEDPAKVTFSHAGTQQ